MHYVYVLESLDEAKVRYIGYSSDLRRRLEEHNSDDNLGFTRGRKWKLLYYEAYLDKVTAIKREKSLKTNGIARQMLYKRIGNPRSSEPKPR